MAAGSISDGTATLPRAASAPQLYDKLPAWDRRFMQEEFRSTFPYRNDRSAKYELRRRFNPHKDFVRPYTVDALSNERLYDLRVNHSFLMRARTGKSPEPQVMESTASRKPTHQTAADQVRQLCNLLGTKAEKKPAQERSVPTLSLAGELQGFKL